MTPVATRDGSALGSSVGPIAGCWRGKMGGQDKRPASSLAVCGWFNAAFPYGTGGVQPYAQQLYLIVSIACRLAIPS